MKQVITISTNKIWVNGPDADSEKVRTWEVILVFTEPAYRISSAGDVIKDSDIETVRFVASDAQLEHIAKILLGYATEKEDERNDA
jgi:hypothetical protein